MSKRGWRSPVALLFWEQVVHSSNPVARTLFFLSLKPLAKHKRGVAQPGSAPVLGTGGRRFESCRPDTRKLRRVKSS